jgi:hypothetical protein
LPGPVTVPVLCNGGSAYLGVNPSTGVATLTQITGSVNAGSFFDAVKIPAT